MSNLIEWSDKLSVGIEEIDQQHRVLVGMLNEFHDAIHHHKGSEVARQIIKRLTDYTLIHFAVEEGMMRLLDYPDYEEHKEEHDALIEEIQQLSAKLVSGKKSVNFELLHFLKVWLTKHIQESDRHYIPHFLSHGIKSQQLNKVDHGWMGRVVGKLFH
jgi:hemerythrin